MLNPTFDDLYTELVSELDRYATAQTHTNLEAGFASRDRLAEIRQLLAVERSDLTS